MGTPIPDPPIDAIIDDMKGHGQRLSLVWRGLRDVLHQKMPGLVTAINTLQNRSGNRVLVQPQGYFTSGEAIDTKDWPVVIAGAQLDMVPTSPLLQTGEANSIVYIIWPAAMVGRQVNDSSDYGQLAYSVLRKYQGGYLDANGRKCWDGLGFSGFKPIPQDENSVFGGWQIEILARQSPGIDRWS